MGERFGEGGKPEDSLGPTRIMTPPTSMQAPEEGAGMENDNGEDFLPAAGVSRKRVRVATGEEVEEVEEERVPRTPR